MLTTCKHYLKSISKVDNFELDVYKWMPAVTPEINSTEIHVLSQSPGLQEITHTASPSERALSQHMVGITEFIKRGDG